MRVPNLPRTALSEIRIAILDPLREVSPTPKRYVPCSRLRSCLFKFSNLFNRLVHLDFSRRSWTEVLLQRRSGEAKKREEKQGAAIKILVDQF